MKVEIPKRLLDSVECYRDFSCLKDDGSPLCEVDHLQGMDIYLCLKHQDRPCPSCSEVIISGVNFRTCSCPIRHEIFEKTGK